jgi:hypothetical protein
MPAIFSLLFKLNLPIPHPFNPVFYNLEFIPSAPLFHSRDEGNGRTSKRKNIF